VKPSRRSWGATRVPSYLRLSADDVKLGVVTLAATLGANLLTAVVFFGALSAYHHDQPFQPGVDVVTLVALALTVTMIVIGKSLPESSKIEEIREWLATKPPLTALVIRMALFVGQRFIKNRRFCRHG
jgi:hypothetical protein